MFSGTISRENSPMSECGGNDAAPIAKKRIWSMIILGNGSDSAGAAITAVYANASGAHRKLRMHITGPRRPLNSVSDIQPPIIDPANPPISSAESASPASTNGIELSSKIAAVQVASAIRITMTGMYANDKSMNDELVSKYCSVSDNPGVFFAAVAFRAWAEESAAASSGDDESESFMTLAYPSVRNAGTYMAESHPIDRISGGTNRGAIVPPTFWLVASIEYHVPRVFGSGNHDMKTRARAGHATACPAPFRLHSAATRPTRTTVSSGGYMNTTVMTRHDPPAVSRHDASSPAGSGCPSTYTPQKNLTTPTTVSKIEATVAASAYDSTPFLSRVGNSRG
eukprot:m.105454 g.105454  ORF g.105454 m.105454 type:complete len:340 (-) comp21021_c0_seq1:545-1564(-)